MSVWRSSQAKRWYLLAPRAAKSTIASLLLRLHDPCEGRILIDGQDIRSYTLESLRSQISIVMQDSPLFALSVQDNIALGKTSGTPQEVIGRSDCECS